MSIAHSTDSNQLVQKDAEEKVESVGWMDLMWLQQQLINEMQSIFFFKRPSCIWMNMNVNNKTIFKWNRGQHVP